MQEKRTSDWTVVLSLSDGERLADNLATHGLTLLVIPDLYDLPADHVAVAAVQEIAGPICLVSQYLPRAAYWMLAWRGVKGRRADWPDTRTTGRRIHPVCIAGCDHAQAVQRVLAVTGADNRRGNVRSVIDRPAQRWYPVIDYDRCTGCLACAEFCLFGVYEASADRQVTVARPEQCKSGCPACSWTCPAGAIMFPRYSGGGAVAGDDAGKPERLQGDALRQAARKSIGQWSSAKRSPADNQKIDQAVDELEKF